jgi:hypothetical protein
MLRKRDLNALNGSNIPRSAFANGPYVRSCAHGDAERATMNLELKCIEYSWGMIRRRVMKGRWRDCFLLFVDHLNDFVRVFSPDSPTLYNRLSSFVEQHEYQLCMKLTITMFVDTFDNGDKRGAPNVRYALVV